MANPQPLFGGFDGVRVCTAFECTAGCAANLLVDQFNIEGSLRVLDSAALRDLASRHNDGTLHDLTLFDDSRLVDWLVPHFRSGRLRVCRSSVGTVARVARGAIAAHVAHPKGAEGSITKAQLKKIFNKARDDYLENVAQELNTDPARYGLGTHLRLAHFFAQVREESGAAMEAKVESLNYSPDGLKSTFKYYREHPAEALVDGYEKNAKTRHIVRHAKEETIGNKVYALRNGNGGSASGDGWKFRGRGLIQVTGRGNYKQVSEYYAKLYETNVMNFEGTPEQMAEFPYSLRSAICFWLQHNLHKPADRGLSANDVDRITRVVNAATKSYAERRAHFKVAYDAFK